MAIRNVVFHSPGPKWQMGVDFQEQDETLLMGHVQHYRKLFEDGKLLLGGPFTDLDTGGMMVADGEITRQELEAFAAADPAVQGGLLVYEVRSWYTAMAK